MKLGFSSLVTILLISNTFKTSLADKFCNDFVDEALKDIKSDKEYFEEPYEIPDSEKSFGLYELEYGHIFGLTSLHRINDVVTMKKGKNSHLKVDMAAGTIIIKADVRRKILNFGKSATLDVTIPLMEMTFDIVPKDDGTESTIKDFRIDQVKGLNVKVTGVGFIRDPLLNNFMKLAGKFFQTAVKNALEDKLKRFFKNKVLDYPIPSECLNDTWE